jgi:hypothetical protein
MKPLYQLQPPNAMHQWVARHRWWVMGFWAFVALASFAFLLAELRDDGLTELAVVNGLQVAVGVGFFALSRGLVNAVDRYNDHAGGAGEG